MAFFKVRKFSTPVNQTDQTSKPQPKPELKSPTIYYDSHEHLPLPESSTEAVVNRPSVSVVSEKQNKCIATDKIITNNVFLSNRIYDDNDAPQYNRSTSTGKKKHSRQENKEPTKIPITNLSGYVNQGFVESPIRLGPPSQMAIANDKVYREQYWSCWCKLNWRTWSKREKALFYIILVLLVLVLVLVITVSVLSGQKFRYRNFFQDRFLRFQ